MVSVELGHQVLGQGQLAQFLKCMECLVLLLLKQSTKSLLQVVGATHFQPPFPRRSLTLHLISNLAPVFWFLWNTFSIPSLNCQLPLPASGLGPSMSVTLVLPNYGFLFYFGTQQCLTGFEPRQGFYFYIFIYFCYVLDRGGTLKQELTVLFWPKYIQF